MSQILVSPQYQEDKGIIFKTLNYVRLKSIKAKLLDKRWRHHLLFDRIIFFLILLTHGHQQTLGTPASGSCPLNAQPLHTKPYFACWIFATYADNNILWNISPTWYTSLYTSQLQEICEANAFQKEHLLQRNASQIITYRLGCRRVPLYICFANGCTGSLCYISDGLFQQHSWPSTMCSVLHSAGTSKNAEWSHTGSVTVWNSAQI